MVKIVTKFRGIARKALRGDSEEFARSSYAQEGEDLILQRWLENEKTVGFYVDIGAHHPHRFSNTFMFYKMGWRGINVDAMPGCMELFRVYRPRDINVEAAISDRAETLTYFMFNEPALNGFSEALANERDGVSSYRIVGRRDIRTRTLESLLGEFLPPDQRIDFMSVDVEGFDLNVLQSNDWRRYRPTYLLAEDVTTRNLKGALDSVVTGYLQKQNYALCSKAVHTMFFRDQTQ